MTVSYPKPPQYDQIAANPIFKKHQHVVMDIQSGKIEAGQDIDGQHHLSSQTKWAALAFIMKVKEKNWQAYLKEPQVIDGKTVSTREALRRMMSYSHNDATIVQVARAMNHPYAKEFAAAFRDLSYADGKVDRKYDNLVANRYPHKVKQFFDDYDKALDQYRAEFGISGASIHDTSGRSRISDGSGGPQLHLPNGPSTASARHIANLVKYVYEKDDGQTLRSIASPYKGHHTATVSLAGRDRPGDGQVIFAKTSSMLKSEYGKLPAGSTIPTEFPNGVFGITIGYMQQGKPKMVFLRADSFEERAAMANKFLDDVAGAAPKPRLRSKPVF